jgi:hypothetical protein
MATLSAAAAACFVFLRSCAGAAAPPGCLRFGLAFAAVAGTCIWGGNRIRHEHIMTAASKALGMTKSTMACLAHHLGQPGCLNSLTRVYLFALVLCR